MDKRAVVYLLLVHDHHADTQVSLWSTEDKARSAARRYLQAVQDVVEEELNQAMTEDGWIFCAAYGSEGDYVRIVVRNLDSGVHS